MRDIQRGISRFVEQRSVQGGGVKKHVLDSQIAVLFAVLCRSEIMMSVVGGDEGGDVLRTCLGNVVQAWTRAQDMKAAEEAEGGKAGETEEEREERLLREQFPDYSKDYLKIVKKAEDKATYGEEWMDQDEDAKGEVGVDSSFELRAEQVSRFGYQHEHPATTPLT
jgi:hypothetical protein